MKISFFILSIFLCLNLFAKQVTILEVSNDSEGELYDYKVVLDITSNNRITKFYVDSYLKGNHQAGVQVRETRNIGNLSSGFVLVKRKGYNIAILRGTEFVADRGGELELFYLYQGAISGSGGTYHKKDLSLLSYGNEWNLLNSQNQEVSKADFKVNKLFGIEVGVKDIHFK